MLTNITCSLLNTTLCITRGSGQGQPCSPLFFILYLNPLITALNSWADQHLCFPSLTPTGWDRSSLIHHLVSLFYADDGTLLTPTIPLMQSLLDHLASHALPLRLTLSVPKFRATLLCPATLNTNNLPPLLFNGEPIPWDTAPSFTHLGYPIAIKAFPRNTIPLQHAPLFALRSRLYNIFCTRDTMRIRLLLQLITNLAYQSLLYPTPLVDVPYAAIDIHIYHTLRTIFRGPPGFPHRGLRMILHLWPSSYYGSRRALCYYHRLHHHSPHHPDWPQHPDTLRTPLFRRFHKLIDTSALPLPTLQNPDPTQFKTAAARSIFLSQVLPLLNTKIPTSCPWLSPYITYLSDNFQFGLRRPIFHFLPGRLALLAVRFLLGPLRAPSAHLCLWCNTHPEHIHHLLICDDCPIDIYLLQERFSDLALSLHNEMVSRYSISFPLFPQFSSLPAPIARFVKCLLFNPSSRPTEDLLRLMSQAVSILSPVLKEYIPRDNRAFRMP
jgi:hypothetical protein